MVEPLTNSGRVRSCRELSEPAARDARRGRRDGAAGGPVHPGRGAATVDKVERFVEKLPSQLSFGLKGLLRGLDAASWLGERRPFSQGESPTKRLALLESWRQGDPFRRLMLRALVSPLKIAHFDDPKLYKQLGCVYDVDEVTQAR